MKDTKFILKGRGLTGGRACGEAMVSPLPLGFWLGIEPEKGEVIDRRNPLYGKRISGKVLIFPYGRGSTGGSAIFIEAVRLGNAPCAIINVESEPILVMSALIAQKFYGVSIPIIDRLDKNPIEIIRDGDLVLVDGDQGIVEIRKKKEV